VPGVKNDPEHLGNSEAVLRFVQERSDDIVRAVIPMSSYVIEMENGIPTGQQIADVGMILVMIGGDKSLLMRQDAEIVLNDGILNRMKIVIELCPPAF